jgi:hypothetical protein
MPNANLEAPGAGCLPTKHWSILSYNFPTTSLKILLKI